MHPGPVNRGVELAAEVIDSPQAVIGQQVAAGVVVRMAVLYELLAGRGAPAPQRRVRAGAAAGMSVLDSRRDQPPADLLVRGAHVLDPRAGIDAPHDVLVRGGEIAELGAPGALEAPDGAEVLDGEGRHLFPGFVDPHVHLRTPGPGAQGGPRLRHPRRRRRRLRRRRRDAQHRPGGRLARRCCARCARRPRREARIPVGFMAAITRGLDGEALTEMAELRDAGALGFTDDGKPVHRAGILRKALQYQRLARRRARACTRRTRRCPAAASCTRARCPRGSGWPASRRSPSRR